MQGYAKERRLQLAADRGIVVDPQDRWLLENYTWRSDAHGYMVTNSPTDAFGNRQNIRLHHMIMGCPIWEGEEIDHINHDPADNRRCNLRYATHTQNMNNMIRKGTVGIKNIMVSKTQDKYDVKVRRNGSTYWLGTFSTLDEAVAERDQWLWQYSTK